jgi:modification methylase
VSAQPAQSVWPVTQQTARAQRRSRYLPASTAHPGKMLPELARCANLAYSDVGQLVLDPMCGIGTTLVEAVHLGRQAVGVELEPRWAAISAANLCLAREQGATGRGLVTRGDARRLGRGLLDELQNGVQLILSSPPYGDSLHGHVRKRPNRVEKYNDRYSHNPDNLAHLPPQHRRRGRPPFAVALAEIIAGCRRLLAPGASSFSPRGPTAAAANSSTCPASSSNSRTRQDSNCTTGSSRSSAACAATNSHRAQASSNCRSSAAAPLRGCS